MTEAQRTWQASDHRRVAGRYELVGVNGSLLPAEVDDEMEEGPTLLSLTARYDTTAGASYTKELDSTGTWRFVASALDGTSGEIAMVSANGGTSSAAVTRLSLVHRTRAPWGRRRGPDVRWVYIRRSAARRVWSGK